MIDLYLIRHAKSEANETPHLITGRSNHSPLSEKGERQAHLLGERFRDEGITFDDVYSSTAVRTQETAKIVCSYIGFSLDGIVANDDFLELDQGDWVGRDRNEIYTPEVLQKINSNNWQFRPPNGESQKEVEDRMYARIEQDVLQQVDQDLRVAVFGHGMAIKCFLRRVMEFTPNITYRIWIKNTGITQLHYKEDGWYPIRINDSSHLIKKGRQQ